MGRGYHKGLQGLAVDRGGFCFYALYMATRESM